MSIVPIEFLPPSPSACSLLAYLADVSKRDYKIKNEDYLLLSSKTPMKVPIESVK
jgi:hypothetical protein